ARMPPRPGRREGDQVATPDEPRAGCPLHGAYRPGTCLWCHYGAYVDIAELLARQLQGQLDVWEPGCTVDSVSVAQVLDDGVLVEARVAPEPGAPTVLRRFIARPNGTVL